MSSSPSQSSDLQRSHTCTWCGAVSDGASLSCKSCGAALDVRAITTTSGWTEVPGRKDMAKIQFGKSSVQIEGAYVPVADFNLSAEDSIYFAHHVLLWKDTSSKITTMSMKGAWKRMLAGMPVIMTQAQGPGRIAFSRDEPGELIALPMQPGYSVDVREHIFLVASGQVAYDFFQSNIWFSTRSGDETETFYPVGMFMDRFTAPKTPGLLLLHGAGNVFVRKLRPQETILVKPTALLFKDSSVQMQLHTELPNNPAGIFGFSFWTLRHLWLRLTGPGRVAIQSDFDPVEDDGKNMTGSSNMTSHRW